MARTALIKKQREEGVRRRALSQNSRLEQCRYDYEARMATEEMMRARTEAQSFNNLYLGSVVSSSSSSSSFVSSSYGVPSRVPSSEDYFAHTRAAACQSFDRPCSSFSTLQNIASSATSSSNGATPQLVVPPSPPPQPQRPIYGSWGRVGHPGRHKGDAIREG